MVTIGFIFAYHLSPWNSLAGTTQPYMRPGYNAAVYVQRVESLYNLTFGAIMLALWDGMFAMSGWDRFESSVIEIFIHEHMIGKVWITRYSDALDAGSKATNNRDGDSIIEPPDNSSVANIANDRNDGESGRYIAPGHPELSLVYDFDGPKLNSKDVFTAIIEGMIIVAHDGSKKPFDYLTSVSASRQCALHLRQVRKSTSATGLMAAASLEMLADLVVKKRRFQTVEFALDRGQEPDKRERAVVGNLASLSLSTANRLLGENATTA
ncbi:MAG: hypothetical protein Q9218_004943 [Villophora microphyllina]